MITTGDIKISVLIEEDATPAEVEAVMGEAAKEKIKKAHEDARRAIRGRKALRAIHTAFSLSRRRKGAGMPTDVATPSLFRSKPSTYTVTGEKDREAAVSRLDGMEDVLVSGVHLNLDQSRLTVFDLPDRPGVCAKVFNTVAKAGILVDTIVQNITGPGRAELSFTVPKADLNKAIQLTDALLRPLDAKCRVGGEADIAVLYVFGVGMRTHTGVARTMFAALAELGINIGMINTSEVCIGVVIEKARGAEALAGLKAAFNVG